MSRSFQEIDTRPTPMGTISLRRRLEPTLNVDVFEVKLDDEFLMSSLFTAGEAALAALALAEVDGDGLDVVVGGLGLGYTARAALDDQRVRRLDVVEAIDAVIDWHHGELVPNAAELTADPRCTLVHGDFFELIAGDQPIGPGAVARFDAVLVDIDHTPTHHLAPDHAGFYSVDGLRQLASRLHPGGVFGLWSDRDVDDAFLATLRQVFSRGVAHEVTYPNHYTGEPASDTVYVATADS
ncbi:MAG: spermidine synthase [Acidimicrobiales bacterium]|nr:spermidine synthase [Acidimicrobiales bacterium]